MSTNVPSESNNKLLAAEITLQELLNEPYKFVPSHIRKYTDHLPQDKPMSIEEIAQILNTQPFIVSRLIRALSLSSVNEDETWLNISVVQKLIRIFNSTIDVRCLLLFKMLDANNDHYVSRGELSRFYTSCLETIKYVETSRVPSVIEILLKRYHLNKKRRIRFDEFYSIVMNDEILLESLAIFTDFPTWVSIVKPSPVRQNIIQRYFMGCCQQDYNNEELTRKITFDRLKDNVPRVIAVLLYILVNIALMLYVIIYRVVVTKANVFVVFARIGGMLLNLNCSLIIVVMLRRSIFLIRATPLHRFLPIDDHIDFHKFLGRFIGALSILHTLAHAINFGITKGYSWPVFMFTTRPNVGWIGGFAPLSGVILCIILLVMIICSMHWIRRGGHFQVFYWTHLLYIPFFAFLIFHATNFWKWAIGPLTLLFLEKLYSFCTRYWANRGRTYLLSATIEQSNVVSLTIHRPKYFTFKPGDYIFINIPQVANYEYHPFTITSAPEELGYIRVHIQAVGNWTKKVYERFKIISENSTSGGAFHVYRADQRAAVNVNDKITTISINIPIECEDQGGGVNDNLSGSSTTDEMVQQSREKIILNGPYSTCARYIFDCNHALLIGAGIGITPYASILSSLMVQFRENRVTCNHCQKVNYPEKNLWDNQRLKKVDFIWVTPDSKSFEWFLDLLCQFEKDQAEYLKSNTNKSRFLNIQLYFTGIKENRSVDQVLRHQVTNIWADEMGSDIFTGLKSPTNFGRPDWEKLLRSMTSGDNSSTAKDINVFFCGPKSMGKKIQHHCVDFGIRYYEEKF
ncbi:unnamed protein product [Rotaria socialis]|uniref:NADPH oxidase n=3 Tax=Rotaria socialis TaxID=392032 RepID=A0A817MXT3_9BILA|nr:unnamed protein product [Rotaria socialis]